MNRFELIVWELANGNFASVKLTDCGWFVDVSLRASSDVGVSLRGRFESREVALDACRMVVFGGPVEVVS